MFNRHYRKVKVLFGLFDALLTALAFECAYRTRTFLPLENLFYLDRPAKALLLIFSVLAWLVIGYWFDIYDKLDAAQPAVVLRETFRQCALGTAALILFEYLLRLELSRPFLMLFVAYAWTLLCIFRLNAGRVMGAVRREFGALHFTMIVGDGQRALHIAELLEDSEKYGIRLNGFFTETPAGPAHTVTLRRTYEARPLRELPDILKQRVVDEIIFAVDSERLPEMEEMMLLCDEEGVRTRVAVDFFPHVNSQIYLDRLGSYAAADLYRRAAG